jgi:hypothetical protein
MLANALTDTQTCQSRDYPALEIDELARIAIQEDIHAKGSGKVMGAAIPACGNSFLDRPPSG